LGDNIALTQIQVLAIRNSTHVLSNDLLNLVFLEGGSEVEQRVFTKDVASKIFLSSVEDRVFTYSVNKRNFSSEVEAL
jgi:hypothetical protein